MEGNTNAAGETRYSESIGILFVVREAAPAPPPAPASSSSAAAVFPRAADSSVATAGSTGSGVAANTSAGVFAGGAGRRGSNVYGRGGGDGGGVVEVDGQPSRLVTVRNLRPRRRVVMAVVNVSMYFSVTPVVTGSGSAASEEQEATVAAAAVAERASAVGGATFRGRGGDDGGTLGFRGWGQGLGAVGAAGGIELFDVPAGESLTLRVTPRLDKLRSGTGLALLANEQSLEVGFGRTRCVGWRARVGNGATMRSVW